MSRFKTLEEYVDGGSIKEAVGFGMKKFSFDTLPPQLSALVIANVPVRSSLELMKVNKKLRGHQLHYGPFKNRKVRTIRFCCLEERAHVAFSVGAPRKWIGKQGQSIFIDEFPVNDLGLVRPQETPSPSYLRWPSNELPTSPSLPSFSYQYHDSSSSNFSSELRPLYQSYDQSFPSLYQSFDPWVPNFLYQPYSPYHTTTSASGPYCPQPYYDLSEVYERPLQQLLRSIKSCVRMEFGHYSTHSCPLKIDVVKVLWFDAENLKSGLDLLQPVVTNRFHLQLAATQKNESIEKIWCWQNP